MLDELPPCCSNSTQSTGFEDGHSAAFFSLASQTSGKGRKKHGVRGDVIAGQEGKRDDFLATSSDDNYSLDGTAISIAK